MRKNRRTDRYKDTVTGTLHAFQCVDSSLFSKQKYIHTLSIYMSKKTEHNFDQFMCIGAWNPENAPLHQLVSVRARCWDAE